MDTYKERKKHLLDCILVSRQLMGELGKAKINFPTLRDELDELMRLQQSDIKQYMHELTLLAKEKKNGKK